MKTLILPVVAVLLSIAATGCQSNSVYFAPEPRRGIEHLPVNGGTPKVLVSQVANVMGMAASPSRQKMYASLQDSIRGWSLDDGSGEQLLLRVGAAACLALDETAERLYWGDQKQKHIANCDLQGGDLRVLVTGVNYPEAVSVSPKLGCLYWAQDNPSGGVWMARLDGTEPRLISAEPERIVSLAVDTKSGQIFWARRNIFGKPARIVTANFDGSGTKEIISDPNAYIEGLAVDSDQGRVVWMERRKGGEPARIQSAELDGSSVKTVHEFAGADYARALMAGPPRKS